MLYSAFKIKMFQESPKHKMTEKAVKLTLISEPLGV